MPSRFMTTAAARAQIRGLEQAVAATGYVDLGMQLASCYVALDRVPEALRIHEAVWEKMQTPETALNYCIILRELGRHAEAMRYSEWAYLNSDAESRASESDAYLRLVHGESLLRAGHWKQAWPIYDTARLTKRGEALQAGLPKHCRMWRGQELGEKDFLFVLMEGGAGDWVNYSRWCMDLGKRVQNWKLFVKTPMAGFFIRWLGRHKVALLGDELEELNSSDWKAHWTTNFALPANFDAGPGDVPQWYYGPWRIERGIKHLWAEDLLKAKFKITRPADGLPVVGLCWEAAELSPIEDPEARKCRSLTEAQAMRLVCQTADRVHWVSAQWSKTLGWPMSRIPFESWEDTGGLLENLDALLTVDTGTLHLAGALCRPLGILLGSNSDWKYLDKGKCPFYRSAKLYRNGEGGGFENAVNLAIAAIRRDGLGAFV